jgi:RNA polymerase sigma-70 factor (ECF subfamily)
MEAVASDWALMMKVVARDESALAALYDRYSGLVFSVLMRVLRDAQSAEELMQDVFFQLWRNAARFDPARGSLPGFLLVAARNRAISRLRRRKATEADELEENAVIVPSNLESSVAQKQMVTRVTGAMEGLPAAQRQAMELAFFEGMTHSEIAERTGEPLGTIKTRLRTAVETLKRTVQT